MPIAVWSNLWKAGKAIVWLPKLGPKKAPWQRSLWLICAAKAVPETGGPCIRERFVGEATWENETICSKWSLGCIHEPEWSSRGGRFRVKSKGLWIRGSRGVWLKEEASWSLVG